MPTAVTQAFITAGTALLNGTAYVLAENVTMTAPFTFEGSGAGVTFDGSGHTITVPDNWPGLFSQAVTVSNLGVLSTGSTLPGDGWFFGHGVGGSATNCYSTGTIGENGGGIFGGLSSGTATNCYSTGVIGTGGGGIFGPSSFGSATNCYSTGSIGETAGGIFGVNSTNSSSATNCYSTGIADTNASGIYGPNSTGTPTNCYSTNGGLWSDAAANAQLTGVPGQPSPVWLRYNNVADTPYLLVANPQPPSDNINLQEVVVNGVPLVASGYAYTYTFDISASTIPIFVRTEEPHAVVRILETDLSGGGDLSGSLTGIAPGSRFFYIQVVPQNGDQMLTTTYSLSITRRVLIDQAFVDASTALVDGTPYIVVEDLSMNSPFLFAGTGAGITMDGSGHTVTVPDQWTGLFSQAVTVSNLGVLSSGTPLLGAGYFFRTGVGGNATNCYSTGVISVLGGGIFGRYSSGTATNCYSTGTLGLSAGGIFGGNSSNSSSATNCYSTGVIGTGGGGIFGPTGSGSATNCYSTGSIGETAGGIFGINSSSSSSATNCYSTGIIGPDADGIFGFNSTGTVTHCYFTSGGQWSDTAANAQLTGYPGQPSPVWIRYNNVADTPYLLVANPQPPSNDVNLLTVVVNGSTRVASNGAYAYTFDSSAAIIPVLIRSEDPHAIVSIQDLSGGGDVSGNLTGLVSGANSFTIQVVSDSGVATASYPLTITRPLPITNIDQAFVTAGTALMKGNSYRLVADLTMTVPFSFSPNGTGAIIVEGSGHTITVPGNWAGLFSQTVTVSNLGVLSTGQAQNYAGWFFARRVGGTATNCYSTGAIGAAGGGIFGGDSNGSATNCYSTGTIGVINEYTGYAGGIFGIQSNGTATNCYSTGAIGHYGGGIFGRGSNGSATNCYSTGTIGVMNEYTGYAGGIFSSESPGTATNCYSTGVISRFGGGIFGRGSPGTATNCYSTGTIGEGGGGIFGNYSYGSATNCYSTGTIGSYGGGIFGQGSSGTVTNVYSTNGGLWSDTAANAQLTGVPGQPSPVWLRYNNVADTPYLLVANPQPPSNDVNLLTVVVNGHIRVASNGAYTYTFDSSASIIPVLIRSEDPHAIVSIQDLSGGGDVSGNLTGLVTGTNSFTIQVVSDSGVATATYPLTIQTLDISSVFVNGALVYISNGVYDVTLSSTAASVPVRIITDDPNARVAIEGTDLSGTYDLSGSLSLPITGSNLFTITVVAPNGANSTYPLTIVNPISIDQAFVTAGTALMKGYAYTVTENLTMTTPFSFSPNGTGAITVEGSGHTITVPGNWAGLFSQAVTVSNLGVLSTGSTQQSAGWFFANVVGGNATNCYSTGAIGEYGGGIFGASIYNRASNGSATNCYSTGAIGRYGGGIFGNYSDGSATNCYSTGAISVIDAYTGYAGGIFGASSPGTATHCYSTGVIGGKAGGIFGSYSNGTATNCYSTGAHFFVGGGIFGSQSSGTATNCYSTGAITTLGGGIFCDLGIGTATNCYSTGLIGNYGGGIFGYNSFGTSTNCYSTGVIGHQAGGIFGIDSEGTATNVYSTNGGLWSDAAANAANALTGVPGQPSPVWLRYNNVADTPYLLVANPQPPSDDVNLLTVVVNGSTRVASNGAYAYTFDSSASTIPVLIRSEDPHAIVSIQDLSGGGDVSGNLTGLVPGTNSFTIQVVSDSGVATASYPLTIQTLSNDDDISSVSVNGALVDISNGVYDVTLSSNVASVPVRIITDDSNARIAIQGTDLSGTHDLSGSLSLPMTGPNPFTIAVVAPNGANATYLLTIRNPSAVILIDQAFVTAGTALLKGNSYIVTENLTMTTPFSFSPNGSGAITVEGSGHTITVPDQWLGLFSQAVTVSNLGVLSTGATQDYAGWFFQPGVGGTAQSCYSTGAIGTSGGGLFGNQSSGVATNCYSTGAIGNGGGGIFGAYSQSASATNCYSRGAIDENGAGIFGSNSSGSAANCYSTGTIGTDGGGIFSNVGEDVSITNCYFTNGGQWSDTAANAQLTGYPGQPSPVWLRYNNVANTPYLLVANPQPPTPPAGPSAPTLTTTTLTTQSVNLSWTTPTGATSYKVYESTDSWATSTLVASPSTNTYIINTRRIGSSQFKVSAIDAGDLEGTLSMATASITLLWSPAPPTQVVATSTASGTVNLSWTPPTDTGNSPITSYRVYNSGGARISANITFDASSATLTGLQDSVVYYSFTVSAVNSIGEGPKSNPSNTIITTPLSSSVSSFSSSGSTANFTNALSNITDPAQAILDARVAINNASKAGTLTPAERQALIVAALNTFNTTGANKAIVTNTITNMILASMASVNTTGTINPSLPVGFVIPSYSTGASPHTATLDLQSTLVVNGNTVSYATMISQQLGYLVFELPNTIPGNAYQLTLTNGAASLTLSYDGTVLYDQNSTAYTANSVLQVGTLSIPLLGLGSIGTNTTSLALVTVNSSEPLQTPYAFTVASNDTSASVVIQAKNPQMSVIVRNSSGIAVLDGSLPNPGNVSGSLTSLVTGSNTFTINVTSQDGTVTTNYPLTITRPVAGPVPCFPAGTRILTPTGYKAVETLTQGELVLTADSRQVPVKIYGKHLEATTSVTAPYRVPKGTFGLQNDLLLSPDHAFQIRKGLWMLPKRAALLSDRVEQVGVGKPVTYYHLECPSYLRDNLVVDGAVVESYGGKTKSPYTYSETLKGYTRSVSIKNITKA